MRLLKKRTEPKNLKTLRLLNARMNLCEDSFSYYLQAEKGYKGECLFDQLIDDNLSGDWIILNDLLLEYEKSKFQLDSILISQYYLYNIEVKYFQGDFYLEGKQFFTAYGKEIKHPLIQLEKNESLLRQMIQHSVIPNLKIQSYLIFIHPEFTLYQTPKELKHIIFPTQLTPFVKKLNRQPTNVNQKHTNLAEFLLSHQTAPDPKKYVPEYDYNSLKKLVKCYDCYSGNASYMKKGKASFLVCDQCGKKEKIDDAILRNIKELKHLFPEMKISTSLVFDWCGGVIPRSAIIRVLNINFKKVGNTNNTHYVELVK